MCNVCKTAKRLPLQKALAYIGQEATKRGFVSTCVDETLGRLVDERVQIQRLGKDHDGPCPEILLSEEQWIALAETTLVASPTPEEWLLRAEEDAQQEERARIFKYAQGLSRTEREVLRLYLAGFSRAEIAKTLDTTIDAVYKTLSRIRARVRANCARAA